MNLLSKGTPSSWRYKLIRPMWSNIHKYTNLKQTTFLKTNTYCAGDRRKLVLVQAFLLTKFEEDELVFDFWERGLATSTSSKSGISLNKHKNKHHQTIWNIINIFQINVFGRKRHKNLQKILEWFFFKLDII